MNLQSNITLKDAFDRVAFSKPGFAVQRAAFTLKNLFLDYTGLKPNWAIDRDIIIPKLQEVLSKRHMTKMNAAAFLCALSIRHVHSNYDPVNFLGNFLRLYNAKSISEVFEIEEVVYDTPEALDLLSHYHNGTTGNNTTKLEALKIRCWAKDLAAATAPKGKFIPTPANHKSITVGEVEDLVKHYPSFSAEEEDKPQPVEKLMESDGKATNSAFPKEFYLNELREMRSKNYINETQCGILLCFILHSREKRNDKKTSYVTHPMAVADLVRKHGGKYLKDEGHVWLATLAALLHDGGEKSNIDLEKDLEGLLPTATIEAIKALHKKDGETYFNYLERCANNPLAAVVKLCDIYHNSLDKGTNPGFKQAYVYPIAEAYVEYRLRNKESKLSVAEFLKVYNIRSDKLSPVELFKEIEEIAEHKTDKKKPAVAFRDRLGTLKNIDTLNEIFAKEIVENNAYARSEEDPSLQP